MNQSIIRISKEISDIQKSSDLSLAVACRDSDVRNVKALIIGPHDTPYEFGFFEFIIQFGKDYPAEAPSVQCVTTDQGRCRFNPNIYANGRICLSILGTWRGERGEEWSPAQGLESILLSIQSLMSAKPYENEPGFENLTSEKDRRSERAYARKICHETLRISVIQRLEEYLDIKAETNPLLAMGAEKAAFGNNETNQDISKIWDEDDASSKPFEPFIDLCKQRFLWYYESYLAAIQKGKLQLKEREPFELMQFETQGQNAMMGKFKYDDLERRLKAIRAALDTEVKDWVQAGMEASKAETTLAGNLRNQYDLVVKSLLRNDMPHHVELEHNNAFVWIFTYFGRPMTNLDGGLLRLRMVVSQKFPTEQPRVKFETKIFHHHIAPDGTASYRVEPSQSDHMMGHIDAIIALLEREEPAYDPREIVNPEATKLFWSKDPNDKKQFNRRLRRSVQDSLE